MIEGAGGDDAGLPAFLCEKVIGESNLVREGIRPQWGLRAELTEARRAPRGDSPMLHQDLSES